MRRNKAVYKYEGGPSNRSEEDYVYEKGQE